MGILFNYTVLEINSNLLAGRASFLGSPPQSSLENLVAGCKFKISKHDLVVKLTTPENTITYHNALSLSPQNFAKALSLISLGS